MNILFQLAIENFLSKLYDVTMSCPNCNSLMTVGSHNNQTVLHCENCGGTFFEENGINRISTHDAQILSEQKETDEVSGNDKHCMKDGTIMKVLHNSENIPDDVTLLQCKECKSIFVFADDLIRFKQAQEAKLNYFKSWHIPLPSISSVVVMSFVALIAATIFSKSFFQSNTIGTTQAHDIFKKVYVSKSGQYIFVSFTTQIPVNSEVILRDLTTGKTIKKTGATSFSTTHYITTGDLNTNDIIFYTIVVKDKTGKEVWSEEKKL